MRKGLNESTHPFSLSWIVTGRERRIVHPVQVVQRPLRRLFNPLGRRHPSATKSERGRCHFVDFVGPNAAVDFFLIRESKVLKRGIYSASRG